MQEVNASIKSDEEEPARLLGAPDHRNPKALRPHGWGSRLRSYLIFDPVIWLTTIVLGIIAIPVSLFGEKTRILHNFARFWSQLIMKTILSPTTVRGLEQLDTSKPMVYAANHASAMEQELRKHGFPWPRLEPGDAADLTAFLLARRGTAAAPAAVGARKSQ